MKKEFPTCFAQKHASILQKVFSEAELEADDLFTWIVEGVLILIAFLVGLFGNSFSIVIFSRQKVHRIFHHLLLLLAIFDMVSYRIISFICIIDFVVILNICRLMKSKHYDLDNLKD